MASFVAVSLGNVRVFSGTEYFNFKLKPLTVFAGTNSSGKSTVLKSIALIKQSQQSGDGGDAPSPRLRFKGRLVDLGNYRTFHSDSATGGPVNLGFAVETKQGMGWKRWLKECLAAKKYTPYVAQKGDDELVKLVAKFDLGFVAGENGKTALLHQGLLTINFGDDVYEVRYQHIGSRPEGSLNDNIFEISIPDAIFYAGIPQAVVAAPNAGDTKDFKFNCLVRGLLPQVFFVRQQPDVKNNAPWANAPLPPFLQQTFDNARRALSGIHYIGPLRATPKRYYQVDWDASPSLDPSGNFLPSILRDSGRKGVFNCPPHASTPTKEPLNKALSKWLTYLRTGSPHDYENAGDEFSLAESDAFVEVNLTSAVTGRRYPLVDSGFGMSQIIPVLVRCLLAEKEELVLIEQPELHLHPAFLVRFGEFFAAMIVAGKRIVIETHSEHLVNSIRAIAAERSEPDLAESIGIYFLQMANGTVRVHDMSMNRDGTFSDWPREFFGEALELSARILKAQRAQRARAD